MTDKGTQLLHALEDALRKAPAPERAALSAALDNYVGTYSRSVRQAPPMLRRIMRTLREGAGSELPTYTSEELGRRVTVPEDEETER